MEGAAKAQLGVPVDLSIVSQHVRRDIDGDRVAIDQRVQIGQLERGEGNRYRGWTGTRASNSEAMRAEPGDGSDAEDGKPAWMAVVRRECRAVWRASLLTLWM